MSESQGLPVSLEVQFLGGLSDSNPRPTANMCSPGTHIKYQGKFYDSHRINSSSPTFDGAQWITVEALVLGSDRIVHCVNGDAVIQYANPPYGGVVSGYRREIKLNGELVASGYIALQSESHPIQFRRVALLNLKGCMNPKAGNYKSYFVEPNTDSCKF